MGRAVGRPGRPRKLVASENKLVSLRNSRDISRSQKKNQENVKSSYSKQNEKLLKSIPNKEKEMPSRNVLVDQTNNGQALQRRSLRRRENKSNKVDSMGETSTSTVNMSFSDGVIRSPRQNPSKNASFSCRQMRPIDSAQNSFVMLKGIDEASEKPSIHSAHKTCIYKTAAAAGNDKSKTSQPMLPEEKLKMYEFEVDKNEPKRVKKVRKRKKKNLAVPSDSSDDSCSIGRVTKFLRGLSTQSPRTRKQLILLQPDSKNSATVTAKPSQGLSCCPTITQDSLAKHVHFNPNSTGNLARNSTPQPIDRHVNMLRARYHKILSSPDSSPIPSFTSPAVSSIVNHNTSLDDSCAYDTSVLNHCNSNTSRGEIQRDPVQPEIDRNCVSVDFNKSDRPVLHEVRMTQPGKNLNQSTKSLNLSLSDRVTLRRQYIDSVMSRVSSLEPRVDTSLTLPAVLNVDNCFGFSDDLEPDPSPTTVKSKAHSAVNNFKPVSTRSSACSTPNNSPVPLSKSRLRQVLAPLVAKKPVVPKPLPTALASVSLPTESTWTSELTPGTSLLFSESKDLSPLTFADDELPVHFSKPARMSYDRPARTKRHHSEGKYREEEEEEEEEVVFKKTKRNHKEYTKTEKKDVANWMANINAQFEEIEDVQLCVE